jgi:predicted negative regulator of RcsB-dependent stress response
MAEGYETEDEQLESLKRWWRENGKSTLVAIVIGLVGVFGWQGWQKQQLQQTEAASAIYQNLLQVSSTNNGELSPSQQATANHLATTLKTDFSGSTYAIFAAFYKAKFAVSENDLETAETELQWVLDNNSPAELAIQARLRLARVLHSQQKYDQALALLDLEGTDSTSGFEELRGDVLLAQGDKDGAVKAYQKAAQLNATGDGLVQNPILTMKLQQLDSQTESSTDELLTQQDASEGDA